MAENDDFFGPDAARELEGRLQALGIDATLTVHPGTGHAFMAPHNALGTQDNEAYAAHLARGRRLPARATRLKRRTDDPIRRGALRRGRRARAARPDRARPVARLLRRRRVDRTRTVVPTTRRWRRSRPPGRPRATGSPTTTLTCDRSASTRWTSPRRRDLLGAPATRRCGAGRSPSRGSALDRLAVGRRADGCGVERQRPDRGRAAPARCARSATVGTSRCGASSTARWSVSPSPIRRSSITPCVHFADFEPGADRLRRRLGHDGHRLVRAGRPASDPRRPLRRSRGRAVRADPLAHRARRRTRRRPDDRGRRLRSGSGRRPDLRRS